MEPRVAVLANFLHESRDLGSPFDSGDIPYCSSPASCRDRFESFCMGKQRQPLLIAQRSDAAESLRRAYRRSEGLQQKLHFGWYVFEEEAKAKAKTKMELVAAPLPRLRKMMTTGNGVLTVGESGLSSTGQ